MTSASSLARHPRTVEPDSLGALPLPGDERLTYRRCPAVQGEHAARASPESPLATAASRCSAHRHGLTDLLADPAQEADAGCIYHGHSLLVSGLRGPVAQSVRGAFNPKVRCLGLLESNKDLMIINRRSIDA